MHEKKPVLISHVKSTILQVTTQILNSSGYFISTSWSARLANLAVMLVSQLECLKPSQPDQPEQVGIPANQLKICFFVVNQYRFFLLLKVIQCGKKDLFYITFTELEINNLNIKVYIKIEIIK